MGLRIFVEGHVAVLHWLDAPTHDDVRTLMRELGALRKRTGRLLVGVSVVDAGLPVPPPDVRDTMSRTWPELAALTHRQWVGDGSEWDGDLEWPALLRRLDRSAPGYAD